MALLGKEQDRFSDYYFLLPSPLPVQITEQKFKLVSVVQEPRHCQYVQVKPSTWARYTGYVIFRAASQQIKQI